MSALAWMNTLYPFEDGSLLALWKRLTRNASLTCNPTTMPTPTLTAKPRFEGRPACCCSTSSTFQQPAPLPVSTATITPTPTIFHRLPRLTTNLPLRLPKKTLFPPLVSLTSAAMAAVEEEEEGDQRHLPYQVRTAPARALALGLLLGLPPTPKPTLPCAPTAIPTTGPQQTSRSKCGPTLGLDEVEAPGLA